jgi:DNA modification methylase
MNPVLLHGDCLEVMKTLPDKSIDLFLCDLPYGCLGPQKKGGGVPREGTDGAFGGCAWDIPINLAEFWIQVERLMKDDHTPILHFCNTKFGNNLINSKPDWFRYDLVWNKMVGVSFLLANKMPMKSHENIYVFAKKGATYYRKDIEGEFPEWQVGKNGMRSGNHADAGLPKQNIYGGNGTRCALSVIECKTARSNQKGEKKEHKHPTQKPNDLYAFLIERYSKEGDTILDPTAGSFASVFTATRMNRKAIGIEKDKTFYDKASSHFENEYGGLETYTG